MQQNLIQIKYRCKRCYQFYFLQIFHVFTRFVRFFFNLSENQDSFMFQSHSEILSQFFIATIINYIKLNCLSNINDYLTVLQIRGSQGPNQGVSQWSSYWEALKKNLLQVHSGYWQSLWLLVTISTLLCSCRSLFPCQCQLQLLEARFLSFPVNPYISKLARHIESFSLGIFSVSPSAISLLFQLE